MKRFALIIMTIATIFAQQVHAQYYSVNFDAKTVAAMVAAYGTGTVAEAYYDEQVQNILKRLPPTVLEPLQKRIMTSRCRIY